MVEQIKNKLKKTLTDERKHKLHRFISKNPLAGAIIGLLFGRNLSTLAVIYNTDKYRVGGHYYAPHYQNHLKKFKYKKINLLEIGVGGYSDPDAGGESLRMWKRYFPFGKIFSLDIYDKSPHNERRIKIFQGSQVDRQFLDEVIKQMENSVDIIIDDGSHINEHVITTFEYLFPRLKDGGIYVIEDTQTSYWPEMGGSSQELNHPDTMMTFFKQIPDCLNHVEFKIDNYQPTYYDKHITAIHFYHNLIFIQKGRNDEPSNIVNRN